MERADRTRRSVVNNVLKFLLFSCFCLFTPVGLVICSVVFDGRLFGWKDNSNVLLFPASIGSFLHNTLGLIEYLNPNGNGRRTSNCEHREDPKVKGLFTITGLRLTLSANLHILFHTSSFSSSSFKQTPWIITPSQTAPMRKPMSHTTPTRKPTT